MHSRRLILPLALLGTVAACQTPLKPKIQSNKDAAYAQRLTNVLLATDLRTGSALKMTPIDTGLICKAIEDKLAARGVTVTSIDLEGGDGNTRALADAVARARPQQILELAAATVTKRGGLPIFASFDASIYDLALRKRIWRATITTGQMNELGFVTAPQAAADEIATALANKLQADGLL